MQKASRKKGKGDECEIKAAQKLLGNIPDFSNAVITADALHCQARTAREILESGGDYIFQVKDNQKTIHENADLQTRDISPFLPGQKKDTDE